MIAVTAVEYEALRGLNSNGGAVRKAIKLGHKMEGVKKISRFGRSHQIWVSGDFYKKNKAKLKKVS